MPKIKRDANADESLHKHIFERWKGAIDDRTESGPFDGSLVDRPDSEDLLWARVSGDALIDSENFEGKITDNEGRQYTVRSLQAARFTRLFER